MKQIVRWLKTKLSRPESPSHSDAPNLEIESSTDLPNLVIDAPMPDIYVQDELEDTVPNLQLRDSSPSDTNTSPGIDPYDTAIMHKK